MKKTVAVSLGLVTALLALASGAGSKEDDKDSFEFDVAVEQVEVDVQVLKDKQFVSGLTQDDFQVTEDGKKVEIIAFEERNMVPSAPIKPSAVATPMSAAAQATP